MDGRRKPNKLVNRRRLLRLAAAGGGTAVGLAVLAGCGETQIVTETKIQEVIKEVPVDRVVTQEVIKEVPVEKVVEKVVTQIVEKEKIVEKIVTAAPAKPKQITIDVLFVANNPAGIKYADETVGKRFTASLPHVSVNGIYPPYAEWIRKLHTRLAGGNAPDVFLLDDQNLMEFVARGALRPLDEFYKRDEGLLENLAMKESGFDPRIGKQFGLTRSVFSMTWVYNPAMLDKAGIEPGLPGNEWTWDEFVENATKLTFDKQGNSASNPSFDVDNVDQWGVTIRYAWHNQVASAAAQNGGALIDAERRKTGFDDPKVQEAMQWRHDLTWKHNLAAGPVAAEDLDAGVRRGGLVNGRVALYEHLLGQETSWPQTADMVEIKAMGVLKGEKRSATVKSHQLHISTHSDHHDEAWEFLLFHTTDDAAALGVFTEAGYGLPPNTKFWSTESLGLNSHYPRDLTAFLDPSLEGYTNHVGTNLAWSEWARSWRSTWAEANHNRKQPEELFAKMQEDTQTILDRAYKSLRLE